MGMRVKRNKNGVVFSFTGELQDAVEVLEVVSEEVKPPAPPPAPSSPPPTKPRRKKKKRKGGKRK